MESTILKTGYQQAVPRHSCHSSDSSHSANSGYVLFDVLLALFLLALGFAAVFGLIEEAAAQSRQAMNLLEGANFAQSKLDQLAVHSWSDNIAGQACRPGSIVEGSAGKFHWVVKAEWEDSLNLLRVKVLVRWSDLGTPLSYTLESLYAVD